MKETRKIGKAEAYVRSRSFLSQKDIVTDKDSWMLTMMTPLLHWFSRHRSSRLAAGCMLAFVLLLPLALAACNDAPPSTDAALNELHWCDKQTLLFQDATQSPPTPLTDWKQVKAALDFTVYLPQRLPVGACLVSGEALIHDKVLGSSFGVSYLLPGDVTLAFSETALSGGNTASFQCSPSNGPQPTSTPGEETPTATSSPTPTPGNAVTLLCLGGKGQTSIVMGSNASEKELQTLFNGLQSNVDWIPKK